MEESEKILSKLQSIGIQSPEIVIKFFKGDDREKMLIKCLGLDEPVKKKSGKKYFDIT